jgi:hypothetical protein
MIGTSGSIRFKTDAAIAPFIFGITKSRRIKSGFSSPALTIASTPFSASPQMASPCSFSKRIRMASRTTLLSSTIRIFFVTYECRGDRWSQIKVGDLNTINDGATGKYSYYRRKSGSALGFQIPPTTFSTRARRRRWLFGRQLHPQGVNASPPLLRDGHSRGASAAVYKRNLIEVTSCFRCQIGADVACKSHRTRNTCSRNRNPNRTVTRGVYTLGDLTGSGPGPNPIHQ